MLLTDVTAMLAIATMTMMSLATTSTAATTTTTASTQKSSFFYDMITALRRCINGSI
jgi:hypothetical protein